MKRLALIAASIAAPAGCGKAEDHSAAPSPAAAPAKIDTIALPLGTGEPIGTATTYLRYTGGTLVEIDRGSIFGDRGKPFHGLDADGTLSSSIGGFTIAGPHSAFPMASPTAVFVDRATPAAEYRAASATLRGRCWGFAVADHGRLELQEPEPCPPSPRSNDQVNLDIFVTTGGTAAAHLSTGGSAAFATLDQLSAYLVEQRAGALAGRKDLTIGFDDRATIATVVDALGRAHATGFTAAAWVGTVSGELGALTR